MQEATTENVGDIKLRFASQKKVAGATDDRSFSNTHLRTYQG